MTYYQINPDLYDRDPAYAAVLGFVEGDVLVPVERCEHKSYGGHWMAPDFARSDWHESSEWCPGGLNEPEPPPMLIG